MRTSRSLIAIALLTLAGCASEPPAPPPPDQPPPPEEPPPPPEPEVQAASPPEPARPQQTATGKHRISIASERTEKEAAEWIQRAESMGYRAESESATTDGVTWFRVVLPGYDSRDDAIAALPFADKDFGVSGSWRLPRNSSAPAAAAPAPAPAPAPAAEPTPTPEPAPAPAPQAEQKPGVIQEPVGEK